MTVVDEGPQSCRCFHVLTGVDARMGTINNYGSVRKQLREVQVSERKEWYTVILG